MAGTARSHGETVGAMQTTGERRGETNTRDAPADGTRQRVPECGRGARALDTRQPAQIREEEAADFRPADLGLGFPPPESGAGDRPPPPHLTQAASRSPRGSARCRGQKRNHRTTCSPRSPFPKRARITVSTWSFRSEAVEWSEEERKATGAAAHRCVGSLAVAGAVHSSVSDAG